MSRYLFKSHNLIGDALYISEPLRAWLLNNFRTGDELYIQTLPDHVAELYPGMMLDIVMPGIVFQRPEGDFAFEHDFNVSAAFAYCDINKCHLAEGYAALLGVSISNVGPHYYPTRTQSPELWDEIDALRACVLISLFSNSCTSRDRNVKGLPPNKMLPVHKWKPILTLLKQEYPDVPIRFVGAPDDIVPDELLKIINEPKVVYGPNKLALIMQLASLVVTIDNGVSHLAASQHTPTFLMYPRCLGPHYILPKGNPNLEYVHMDPVTVNPAQLVWKLGKTIERFNQTIKGE